VSGYQLLLFVTIVAIPVWLMATRNGPALLAWVILVTCLDILNAKAAVNVSAASITGLLLAPYSARMLFAFRKSPVVAWIAAHYGYLVLLGLMFGLAFPWPDTVGRPLNLRAEGRTVLYLMRETAALSIAVFVAQQVAKSGRPDRVLNGILFAACATSAFAVLEYVTGISYYLLFNEGVFAPTYWNFRVRGLNFEPRGLGLVGAHALVIGILYIASRRQVWSTAATLVTTALAMLLGASTSGMIAAAAGASTVWLSNRRVRRYVARASIVAVVGLAAVAAVQSERINALRFLFSERVGSTVRYGAATNAFEEVVYRMEVFDTSAALFMAAHPSYLFIGTGPGLVSIPASPFMPVTAYTRLYVEPGLNSPPTMGLLLELANGGIVALVLWLGFVFSAGRSLDWVVQREATDSRIWGIARWSFIAAATIYLLAAGFLSSLWPLFAGLGLAAAFLRETSPAPHAPVAHA
jgi:hypothetical protein